MKLGYYPGCSLESSAQEFEISLRAVCSQLNIELEEIEDWACCGASSAHMSSHLLSIALPARTLAQAEAQGLDRVLAPCAACYNRLAVSRHELKEDPSMAEKVARILERPFNNSVTVLNVVQTMLETSSELKEKVSRPLKGFKVACYYGCLLLRPHEVTQFDDPEQPTSMETIVSAIGATPVKWNKRIDCCGASLALSRTNSVIRMGRAILEDAKKAGAELVIVACPLCQANLDLRQAAMAASTGVSLDLPVLYITQLAGLALGLSSEELGLERHLVSAQKLVDRISEMALP